MCHDPIRLDRVLHAQALIRDGRLDTPARIKRTAAAMAAIIMRDDRLSDAQHCDVQQFADDVAWAELWGGETP